MNIFNKLIIYDKGGTPNIVKERSPLEEQMKKSAKIKWAKFFKMLNHIK